VVQSHFTACPVRFTQGVEGAGVHLRRAFGYWYGPVVMNTQEELKTAFEEYHLGTFVKEQ
jgi:hypothetical protein